MQPGVFEESHGLDEPQCQEMKKEESDQIVGKYKSVKKADGGESDVSGSLLSLSNKDSVLSSFFSLTKSVN